MQTNYYSLLNSKRTGTTWARRLIAHLWEISRKMWLHRNHIETPNAETEKLTRRMDRRIINEFRTNLDGLSPPITIYYIAIPCHASLNGQILKKPHGLTPAKLGNTIAAKHDNKDNFCATP
jgi:hypothetical protein